MSPGGGAVFVGDRVELLGDRAIARRHARCRARGYVFPFELCEAKRAATGLLAAAAR
jgi:hypothetical protein